MTTVQLNGTVVQVMQPVTATALSLTANETTSQWDASTVSGIVFGLVTIFLGMPGAVIAVYAFQRHRRLERSIQAMDTSTDLERAVGVDLEDAPQNQTMGQGTEKTVRPLDHIEDQETDIDARFKGGPGEYVKLQSLEKSIELLNHTVDQRHATSTTLHDSSDAKIEKIDAKM